MLHIVPKGIGWLEVICGSMFSGKTEELIRRLRRAEIAKQTVAIFKPLLGMATEAVEPTDVRLSLKTDHFDRQRHMAA